MARIELALGEGNEVSRLWSTAPALGASLQPLLATMYDDEKLQLQPRVREAARMRIARHNACGVCQAHRLRGDSAAVVPEEVYEHVMEPDNPVYDARESLAIEYVGLFAVDHLAIDEAFFARLHEHFSDAEIAELTMLLGVWLGLGRLTRTLDLEEACSLSAPPVGATV